MDSFDVPVETSHVVKDSHVVNELQEYDKTYTLLYDGYAYPFDTISGGYVEDAGYHLINCSVDVDPEIPDPDLGMYEIHADGVWSLEVAGVREFEASDDSQYTLALKVTGYTSYPYSFAEQMRETVDGRFTEYEFE